MATPPNAIVFGSDQVDMRHMVRTGFILNLMGAALITALTFWVVGPMMVEAALGALVVLASS